MAATTANVSGAGNELAGITCTSATHCWAVGDSVATSTSTLQLTLAEEYNHGRWTIASSADVAGGENVLLGVSCAKASRCWAVGYVQSGRGLTLRQLVESNFRQG